MKRTASFLNILTRTFATLFVMANFLLLMTNDVLANTHDGVYTLLSKDDLPIHIGDGRGEIDDIDNALRSSSPPSRHTWTFELGEVPDSIIFTVTIFSLVNYLDQWDCPTTVRVNSERIYDLRKGENVGSWRTTTAKFSVGKRRLKLGTNTIEIREELCTDTGSFAQNDSLIKELTYVLGSAAVTKGSPPPPAPLAPAPAVAAAKGPQLPPAPFAPAPAGFKQTWRQIDGDGSAESATHAIDGYRVTRTWRGGKRYGFYLFCLHCTRKNAEFDLDKYAAIWPLQVGKSVIFKLTIPAEDEVWHYTNTIRVVDTETIRLPFGEVDTYVLVVRTEGTNNSYWFERRAWYAPSIGWPVRFVSSDRDDEKTSWETVSYQLP